MNSVRWTDERKLDALLRLPWRLQLDRNAEEGYWVIRAEEVPSAIASSHRLEDLEAAFWESLRESLRVLLEYGDTVPLPSGVTRYPWEFPKNYRRGQPQIEATTAAAYLASQREGDLVSAR